MARRVRIFVYEGPEDWIKATLNSPSRYVKGTRMFGSSQFVHEAILPDDSCDEANMNQRVLAVFDEIRGERVVYPGMEIIEEQSSVGYGGYETNA
jgi:hypothetical protein